MCLAESSSNEFFLLIKPLEYDFWVSDSSTVLMYQHICKQWFYISLGLKRWIGQRCHRKKIQDKRKSLTGKLTHESRRNRSEEQLLASYRDAALGVLHLTHQVFHLQSKEIIHYSQLTNISQTHNALIMISTEIETKSHMITYKEARSWRKVSDN